MNPVLVRELRSRFRGPRAFNVLFAFLSLLALVILLASNNARSSYPGSYRGNASLLGEQIFLWVSSAEFLFLAVTTPALTFNAISGEKERQTYELLMATPLSGWAILRGKFGAAMAYVLLLMASAMPLMSIAFLFGGVTLGQVLKVQVSILLAGALFCAIGLCASAFVTRTGRSAVVAFLGVAGICLFPFIFFMLVEIIDVFNYTQSESVFGALLELSPAASIAIIFADPYQAVFWPQSVLVQSWMTALLLLVTGAKIRRDDRRLLPFAGLLTLWLWAWAAWLMVDNPL
jgi:ABC-type transport system involved in multi-copper enzyme maturation permease subunit